MLLAVVTLREGQSGRHYRLPNDGTTGPSGKPTAAEESSQQIDPMGSVRSPRKRFPLTEFRRISVPLYGRISQDSLRDIFTVVGNCYCGHARDRRGRGAQSLEWV